jgi:hypothetical protein
VSRFLLGLLVGAVAGVGGTLLVLEYPRDEEVVPAQTPDAGVAEAAPKGKRRKKRRRKRPGNGNDTETVYIDEVVELTAAQRQLAWKGDSVSLPPRNIDFSGGDDARSLDQSEINEGIASGRRAVVGCIAEARGNAELVATITVKFLVDRGGRVTKIAIQAPAYLHENGVDPCIRRAVRAMSFPATGAATVVTVPFDLR